MKEKRISLVLVLILIFFSSCIKRDGDEPTTERTTEPVTAGKSEEVLLDFWAENMPVLDGSTSTIPLEAAIRESLLGISSDEALRQVSHTTTHVSFRRLIGREEYNGPCDLIFSVPISKEQEEEAQNAGVALEQIPFAQEAFVFMVNEANPVESLTMQQIRDIYSGKITNWKEVGGTDAPILAYQRNEDSGSQNYMHTFMGGLPIITPLTHLVPASMSGLMDVIALYDNGGNALGYSVYAYAAEMYVNRDKVKFIAVDGIKPGKETMEDGTYPLMSNYYAIFRADVPAEASIRTLADWLVSEKGQEIVRKAGYITISRTSGIRELKLYRRKGTGKTDNAESENADGLQLL